MFKQDGNGANPEYQAGTTDRLTRVSSTLAEGDYSLKVTVKGNDTHSSGERAEKLYKHPLLIHILKKAT